MKLIVGLGNPTDEYHNTYHNIGFAALDILKDKLGFAAGKKKFQSLFFKGRYQDQECCLLYPQTYMNRSGDAVNQCVRYYKIPLTHLLVICDSLDLPIAKVRYKENGGDAGHRGMQDIIQKLSSKEFHRITIGIGRPAAKSQVLSYVLAKIPTSKKEAMQQASLQAAEIGLQFIAAPSPELNLKLVEPKH